MSIEGFKLHAWKATSHTELSVSGLARYGHRSREVPPLITWAVTPVTWKTNTVEFTFSSPSSILTFQTALVMGSSSKKKKEKKQDFQKAKLKVGKTRPKNTNATDTSFSAKSIVLKQQNLSETGRDISTLVAHNISLLSSKSESQRKDALAYLTMIYGSQQCVSQPASAVLIKAQPLILDGNPQVRGQLIKLLAALPADRIGSIEQLLLYTRAGMSHLSHDIRLDSLQIMDWLLSTMGTTVVSLSGGWVKTLKTFQNLLSWHEAPGRPNITKSIAQKWSPSTSTTILGSTKLRVKQLDTLAHFLVVGLTKPSCKLDEDLAAMRAAELFPLWHTDCHLTSKQSNPFGHLNLFGVPRDVESELYDGADERREVFCESGMYAAFGHGTAGAKREGGEVGRAAALVSKALRLASEHG